MGRSQDEAVKPSPYLIDTAKRHIEGDVTIEEVKELIDTYYKSKEGRLSVEEERTEEADKVSARITELLQEETFSFTPAEYQRIHRKLFDGIFKFAGKYRDFYRAHLANSSFWRREYAHNGSLPDQVPPQFWLHHFQ